MLEGPNGHSKIAKEIGVMALEKLTIKGQSREYLFVSNRPEFGIGVGQITLFSAL